MWERRAELEGFAAVMEGGRNKLAGLKGRAIAGPHDYQRKYRRWSNAAYSGLGIRSRYTQTCRLQSIRKRPLALWLPLHTPNYLWRYMFSWISATTPSSIKSNST